VYDAAYNRCNTREENTYARWIAPHVVRECQASRARPNRCRTLHLLLH